MARHSDTQLCILRPKKDEGREEAKERQSQRSHGQDGQWQQTEMDKNHSGRDNDFQKDKEIDKNHTIWSFSTSMR